VQYLLFTHGCTCFNGVHKTYMPTRSNWAGYKRGSWLMESLKRKVRYFLIQN